MGFNGQGGGDGRVDEPGKSAGRETAGTDGFVRFVNTEGTSVTGRDRDKPERIAETVTDLQLASEGALSLVRRTARIDQGRWFPALARACSIFLRKMVIGDRNNPATRLLDEDVIAQWGLNFEKLRRIPAVQRTLEVGIQSLDGFVKIQKLDEFSRLPEGTVVMPIAPQSLKIIINWPLPGTANWTKVPTEDRPWMIAPGELFELEGKDKLGCSGWLGQQLVMFDQAGITLKDVIRTVATYEGAHSINVSRLLQEEGAKVEGPFAHPEWHILDNVTVFGMKYTHLVVVECALYLYEKLVEGGHADRLDDEKWRLRPSFVALDEDGFFAPKQGWLGFAGGLILSTGTVERSIVHSIRATGKRKGR